MTENDFPHARNCSYFCYHPDCLVSVPAGANPADWEKRWAEAQAAGWTFGTFIRESDGRVMTGHYCPAHREGWKGRTE